MSSLSSPMPLPRSLTEITIWVPGLISLLTRDFLSLILVVLLISLPLAYLLLTKWLASFAYRVPVNFRIFFLAGALVMLIALLTVSVQVLKAAFANPVKALRSE